MGRTAPWAKVLATVLLALLAVVLIAFGAGRVREASRKDAAFEVTRASAQRFANAVVAQKGTHPVNREDVSRALSSEAGPDAGRLFGIVSGNGSTRVTVAFSYRYERSLPLFGPAEAEVDRCFTVTFRNPGEERQAQITPHAPKTSCTEVAAQEQP